MAATGDGTAAVAQAGVHATFLGVSQSVGTLSANANALAVTLGVADVRLEVGLVPAAGNIIWLSATVAGRATTIEPSPSIPIGTIVDASKYAAEGTVRAIVRGGGGGGGAVAGNLGEFQIAADDMRVPMVGGWYTMGIAPLDNDFGDRESSLPQRAYPFSAGGYDPLVLPPTMLGAGTQQIEVPAGAVQMAVTLWHRNEYAAAAGNVGFRLAYIRNPSNGADSAWLTHDFTDLVLPNNAFLQKTSVVITFASMGTPIVAGDLYTFQFCRKAPAGGDLANYWALVLAKLVFS